MAGEYEKAISIKDAIDRINQNDYLLPAIQRKFVWSSQQICVLFDSIIRGYPISSFMMWEVQDSKIKNDYKFYKFLTYYCKRFNEENPLCPTNAAFKNFQAIIDGQQRLTSLYIGLCGTYAYKQPRVWWPSTQDDRVLPPRKLYLDLARPVDSEEDESLMRYNFRFLTEQQYQSSRASADAQQHWLCLHEILRMPRVEGGHHVWSKVVRPYLDENGLIDNEFAHDTLGQLYDVIRSHRIIHYFKENSQKIDHVLDVFIRTNSGGTKLEFSDLLTSIAVAHWDGDFRKELSDLTTQIYQSGGMGFYLDRDWILKTCLVLTDADVRFKVKNFRSEQVERIQSEWTEIKDCIKASLVLVRRFGINPQSLTSSNAVIPICYYLYKKKQDNQQPLFKSIDNLAKHDQQRSLMSRWLYMVILKGVFGGQADTILKNMRDVLDNHMDDRLFPLDQIITRFSATNKDLRFDDEYIESLLDIEYGEGRCRALLHLLCPEMNPTEVFHIDHLHPKSAFQRKKLEKLVFLSNDQQKLEFFSDARHWNTITNLHLLNDSQNLSKKDRPLKEWLNDQTVHLSDEGLLIEGVDLNFDAFPEFYRRRRTALKQRLMARVIMTTPLVPDPLPGDGDEEVVEESAS